MGIVFSSLGRYQGKSKKTAFLRDSKKKKFSDFSLKLQQNRAENSFVSIARKTHAQNFKEK